MKKIYIMAAIFGIICGISVCAQANAENLKFESKHLLEEPVYGIVMDDPNYLETTFQKLDKGGYTYSAFSGYTQDTIYFISNVPNSRIKIGESQFGHNYELLNPSDYNEQVIFFKIEGFTLSDYQEFFYKQAQASYDVYEQPEVGYYNLVLYLIVFISILISLILIAICKDDVYVLKLLSVDFKNVFIYSLIKVFKVISVIFSFTILSMGYFAFKYYMYFNSFEKNMYLAFGYQLIIIVIFLITFNLRYLITSVEKLRREQL